MAQIKQSVPDWCFYKDTIPPDEYNRRLREIGYDGVEMVAPSRWNAARNSGVSIVNLGAPGMAKGLNRTDNHPEVLAGVRTAISTASQNNIPKVIIFSGNREEQDDEEGKKNCVTGIKEVLAQAEEAGVTLVLELLNSHDHTDYQADHGSYGFDVVRAVGSRSVKVLYDIYHMYRMGEDIMADIPKNIELIGHLHVAGGPGHEFPGPNQEIDYPSLIATVMEAGYEGYWGQEWLQGDDALGELERAFRIFAPITA